MSQQLLSQIVLVLVVKKISLMVWRLIMTELKCMLVVGRVMMLMNMH